MQSFLILTKIPYSDENTSRSDKGAENYEILMSVVQTLHQNGKNLVDHGLNFLLTSHG